MNNEDNSVNFKVGSFSFSGANINDLESSEYTLVVICLDTSYSIQPFTIDMEKCVENVVQACADSPRSDNLMIRFVTFDRTVDEFHGFKELNKCNTNDYKGMISTLGGATSLYDAVANGVESLNRYGTELSDNDYSVNALLAVITDGLDNNSSQTQNSVKQKLVEAVGEKKLESLVSILVGVNMTDVNASHSLDNFAKNTGFSQFLSIADANPKHLAKLAQFISKSISSQSQALGTGGPSQNLTF